MSTVARRDPADKAKIDVIEEKLLVNPGQVLGSGVSGFRVCG